MSGVRLGPLTGLVVAALAIGVVAGLSPLALVAPLGVGVVALAVASPAAAVMAAVPILLFDSTVATLPGLQLVQYGHEAVVVLLWVAIGTRCLLGRQALVVPSLFWWIAGFLAVGLLSGLVGGVPLSLLLTAAALATKGWAFALAVAQVDWTPRRLRCLARVCVVVIALVFVTSLVNLVAPAAWVAAASGGGRVEVRWLLPSLIGPFLYPIQFGQVLALAGGALVGLAACLRGRARTWVAWTAVLACLFALLSARRLALLAVLAALLVVLVVRRSAPVWVTVAAGLPLVAVLAGPAVAAVWRTTATEYFSANSAAARTQLTLRAFDVASAHFPFGAGFGRYGSFLAGVDYSPEYRAAGFAQVYGLKPTPPDNTFLTDTFWPAVVGEGGYIGAALYVAGVVAVLRLVVRVHRRSTGTARTVALMTGIVWVQALVLSPGGAILNTGATSLVPFLLLGLLCRFAAGAAGPPDGRVHPRRALRGVRPPEPARLGEAADRWGGLVRHLPTVLDQVVSSASNFLMALLVARSSTAADFGHFAIATSVYWLVLGGIRALVAEPLLILQARHGRSRTRMTSAAGLAVGVATVGGLVGAVGALVWGADPVVVLLLCLPVLIWQDVLRYCCLSAGRPWLALLSDALWLVALAGCGVLVLALHLRPTVSLWLLLWAAGAAVPGLLMSVRTGVWPLLFGQRRWWSFSRRQALPMLGDFAVVSLSENGFVLLLPLLTSFSLLGQVKAAQVANGPLNVLTAAAALAGLPVLARRRAVEGAVPLRAAVALAGGLATTAAGYGVVLLLLPVSWGQLAFGDSWVGVGVLPALVAFQYAVRCCAQGALVLLRAIGEVRRLLVARMALVPVQLGLPLLAAWWGGVTLLGAALIVVAAVFGVVWWAIAVRTARSTVAAAVQPQPAAVP